MKQIILSLALGMLLFPSLGFTQRKPLGLMRPLLLTEVPLKLPERGSFLLPDPFQQNHRDCPIEWHMRPAFTGGVPADFGNSYNSDACMCNALEQHVHLYMGQWLIPPVQTCYCFKMQFYEPPQSTFSLFW